MTFQEKEAKLSAGTVKYFVGGDGPPILYLHSGGGVRLASKPINDWAESFTIYMPVTPGFDGTDFIDGVDSMNGLADLWAEFIDTVIGGQCDVIGYSFGGWTAAWLAVLHGDKIGQMVLEGPAGFRPEGVGGLATDPKEFVKQMYAHPEKIPEEGKPEETVAHNREAMGHYHDASAMDKALVARLGEIEALTLIMHGTADGAIPEESPRLLKSLIPRSFMVYIYDAAHVMEIDQPERVSLLVRDFLTRAEGFLVNWGDEAAGLEAATAAR